eukprot:403355611
MNKSNSLHKQNDIDAFEMSEDKINQEIILKIPIQKDFDTGLISSNMQRQLNSIKQILGQQQEESKIHDFNYSQNNSIIRSQDFEKPKSFQLNEQVQIRQQQLELQPHQRKIIQILQQKQRRVTLGLTEEDENYDQHGILRSHYNSSGKLNKLQDPVYEEVVSKYQQYREQLFQDDSKRKSLFLYGFQSINQGKKFTNLTPMEDHNDGQNIQAEETVSDSDSGREQEKQNVGYNPRELINKQVAHQNANEEVFQKNNSTNFKPPISKNQISAQKQANKTSNNDKIRIPGRSTLSMKQEKKDQVEKSISNYAVSVFNKLKSTKSDKSSKLPDKNDLKKMFLQISLNAYKKALQEKQQNSTSLIDGQFSKRLSSTSSQLRTEIDDKSVQQMITQSNYSNSRQGNYLQLNHKDSFISDEGFFDASVKQGGRSTNTYLNPQKSHKPPTSQAKSQKYNITQGGFGDTLQVKNYLKQEDRQSNTSKQKSVRIIDKYDLNSYKNGNMISSNSKNENSPKKNQTQIFKNQKTLAGRKSILNQQRYSNQQEERPQLSSRSKSQTSQM